MNAAVESPGKTVNESLAQSAFHREQAKHQSTVAKDNQTVTMEMIHQSAWLTPTAFFNGLTEDVSDAFRFCKELESIFDHAFGKESCSLGQFRSALESILSLIPSVAGARDDEGETQAEDGATYEYALEPVMSHETVAIPLLPPIRSRAEAYRRLAEVADYLIRTEPHSPAPYLIRRAISWGGMTLEQLLPELVVGDAALKDLERLLKIETAVKSNAARK